MTASPLSSTSFLVASPETAKRPVATRQQLGILIALSFWFGLITGLGEVLLQSVKGFWAGARISLFQHSVWMAGVADVTIFVSVAIFLFILGLRWPNLLSLRKVGFVFAFLGFLSLLFRISWLGGYASLVLAAGLGVQACRLMAAHAEGFKRLVRWTLPGLVAIVTILTVAVFVREQQHEQSLLAGLPPPPANAPNVLLIVLDTVRAENLSLHGYQRKTTPRLEEFAKRAAVFERAVATASWTLPSHASIFTGRYLKELPKGWTRLTDSDIKAPSLAETFSDRGYTTAGFVANLIACDRDSGLERGFIRYEDYPISLGEITLSSSLGRTITSSTNSTKLRRFLGGGDLLNRKTAATINHDFLSWLDHKGERPFFAFINYFDAHSPYLPPEPFTEKFGPRPRPKAALKLSRYLDALTTDGAASVDKNLDQQQLQAQLNAYDAAIAYVDHNLGLLIDELEKRRILENTLVIITSDHGEEFGEHGVFGHGWNLHWLTVHVPLLISFPTRVPSGKVISEPVSLRDILATVGDVLDMEGNESFPGNSLARYWDDTRRPHDEVSGPLSELGGHAQDYKGTLKSITEGRYHYIRHSDGREELFDIENDSFEKQNLADGNEGRQVCARFRASLNTMMASK